MSAAIDNSLARLSNRLCPMNIFLSVPVKERHSQYNVYPEGSRKQFGSKASKHVYALQDHGLRDFIPERVLKTPEYNICIYEKAIAVMEELHRRGPAKNFCDRFLQSGVWAQDVTGVPSATDYYNNQIMRWSEVNADPAADIQELSRLMEIRTNGCRPNRICMARDVWDAVREHPKFSNRPVTTDRIARKFGVDEIVIMEMIHIKCGFLFLFYQDKYYTPDRGGMTAGVNFNTNLRYREYNGFESGKPGRYIEIRYSFDFRIVSSDCGTLIQNLI